MNDSEKLAYACAKSYLQGGRMDEVADRVIEQFPEEQTSQIIAMCHAIDAYEDTRDEPIGTP